MSKLPPLSSLPPLVVPFAGTLPPLAKSPLPPLVKSPAPVVKQPVKNTRPKAKKVEKKVVKKTESEKAKEEFNEEALQWIGGIIGDEFPDVPKWVDFQMFFDDVKMRMLAELKTSLLHENDFVVWNKLAFPLKAKSIDTGESGIHDVVVEVLGWEIPVELIQLFKEI